jgi:hypothetical protein
LFFGVLLTSHRYKTLSEDSSRLRILNFVKKWADLQRSTFDSSDSLRKIFEEWISYMEKETPTFVGAAKNVLSGVCHSLSSLTNLKMKHALDDEDSEDSDDLPSIIKKKKSGSDLSILVCYDPKEIARQLTLLGMWKARWTFFL